MLRASRLITFLLAGGMGCGLTIVVPDQSAAQRLEEVVVTENGPQILTKFPAQDLFIANKY